MINNVSKCHTMDIIYIKLTHFGFKRVKMTHERYKFGQNDTI